MTYTERETQHLEMLNQYDFFSTPPDKEFLSLTTNGFKNASELTVDHSIAFQPIVNTSNKSVFGYEALVRGINNEGADFVLSQLNDSNRFQFDQATKIKAIQLAKKLSLQGMLSINISPNSVYKPEVCIPKTLEIASKLDFPTNRIMFEVTEKEKITDNSLLCEIFTECKKHFITTAIDDFGAGYAGLNLLADWQPDFIKLDMFLTRNIHSDKIRRILVMGIISICKELDIEIIAEGIETKDEYLTLADMGINLFQGFMFARPGFESLPVVSKEVWPLIKTRRVKDRR